MRRPKGIKNKKSVSKRFKITGTGKVLARHSGMRHLLSGKSSARRNRLGKWMELSDADTRRVKAALPFAH